MADNDLFGDSSSDENTDDLLTAAAKSQPIARPKTGKKNKATNKSQPDADNDSSDDSDSDSDNEAAGLFDSSSEDEEGCCY